MQHNTTMMGDQTHVASYMFAQQTVLSSKIKTVDEIATNTVYREGPLQCNHQHTGYIHRANYIATCINYIVHYTMYNHVAMYITTIIVICDQICQKGSYTHTISKLIFCHHSIPSINNPCVYQCQGCSVCFCWGQFTSHVRCPSCL